MRRVARSILIFISARFKHPSIKSKFIPVWAADNDYVSIYQQEILITYAFSKGPNNSPTQGKAHVSERHCFIATLGIFMTQSQLHSKILQSHFPLLFEFQIFPDTSIFPPSDKSLKIVSF